MKNGEDSFLWGRLRRGGKRWGLVPALLVIPLVWGGCAEDLGGLGTTSILGEVIDPVENSIFGVQIGVVYESLPLSSPNPLPMFVSVLEHPSVFLNPYPNPNSGSLFIPVLVDHVPTSIQVEIRGTFVGGTGPVALVFNGTVTQDTTLFWNGRDNFGDDVPNGLYTVRMTSPPGSAEGSNELTVIMNRSSAQLASQDIFNAVSGPDGAYVLDDLAVEQQFTATDETGKNLGEMITAARVVLAFRDPDYIPRDVSVSIGSGETVEITTQLTPLIPAVAVLE